MSRFSRLCAIAVTLTTTVLVLQSTAGAQDRPNFSGTWVFDQGPVPQPTLRITQDIRNLRITEIGTSRGWDLTYQLDGSESLNETTTLSGETWTYLSQTNWVTNALVITTETTRESIGRSWESLAIYFLDASSGDLSVAKLDAVTFPRGPLMSLRTTTYTRQPD
jgi:hypothetical protein